MFETALPPDHPSREHPVLLEFAVVLGALALLTAWADVVSGAAAGLLPAREWWTLGLHAGVVYLVAFVGLAVAYALARGVRIRVAPPSPADLPLAAVAFLAPVVLAVVTDAVAGVLGVPYSELIQVTYTPDAPPELLALTGVVLPLLWGVALAFLVHGLVQESFRRVLPDRRAVGATVALASVPLLEGPGFDAYPSTGELAFLFAALISLALAAYWGDRVADRRRAMLGYAPFVLLVGFTVGSWLLTESPQGVWFTALGAATVGVAALAYDRGDSLWLPALTYAAFAATGRAIAFLLEAGTAA